ncbi:glycosyltransferase family 2 protein [Gimesia aquarii]|uniref:Hyaluronan synthase n=1 Tax=Gimesia aquarii TaxID=2527964 RepID=A0A517X1N3_9PLAN|nr:glycosyltransferase family 2 protein [Gimesia aquarii]QDU11417.1 Hyaluronan synthase [Gimesia aquarii]
MKAECLELEILLSNSESKAEKGSTNGNSSNCDLTKSIEEILYSILFLKEELNKNRISHNNQRAIASDLMNIISQNQILWNQSELLLKLDGHSFPQHESFAELIEQIRCRLEIYFQNSRPDYELKHQQVKKRIERWERSYYLNTTIKTFSTDSSLQDFKNTVSIKLIPKMNGNPVSKKDTKTIQLQLHDGQLINLSQQKSLWDLPKKIERSGEVNSYNYDIDVFIPYHENTNMREGNIVNESINPFASSDDRLNQRINKIPNQISKGNNNLQESVAIIITSHNYGHYLSECLDSVIGQTHSNIEIIVVDDASSNDDISKKISNKYGVTYLRVENKNVHQSRHDGFLNTNSDFIIFLDADDILSEDYVENGLKEFSERDVGVVYADCQHFGISNKKTNFPEYSKDLLLTGNNFVSCCSIIRREALLLCDAWDRQIDDAALAEDYWMFQRLALDGWDFKKQISIFYYRMHSEQRSKTQRKLLTNHVYFHSHGINHQNITLFVPLAGRAWAWKRMKKYLNRQQWPHDQINLILCDTSSNKVFSREVKQWVADCDYTDVRYYQLNVGVPGLADANRRNREVITQVRQAVCRIYNKLRAQLETQFCWILEDDIVPPDDVLERLLKHFNADVGSVSAPYASRYHSGAIVWLKDGIKNKVKVLRAEAPSGDESPVTEIRGSGFGCLVVRSELLKKHVMALPSSESDLDPYFFSRMGDEWRRICDWSCRCEHYEESKVFKIN